MSIEHIGDYARSGGSKSKEKRTSIMTFAEYQASIICIYEHRPDPLTYAILGIGGESGEVIETYKKAMRRFSPEELRGDAWSKGYRDALLDELGDVLWYTARVAHLLGANLETVAQMNMKKLAYRRIHGKGDNDARSGRV